MHISLDIETAGFMPMGAILSIGCVHFDIETGAVLAARHFHADLASSVAVGLRVDRDVMAWWGRQASAVRASVFSPPGGARPLRSCLESLAAFLADVRRAGPLHVWAYPAQDDLANIELACRLSGIEQPWKREERICLQSAVRTARLLGHTDAMRCLKEQAKTRPSRIAHDALEDATDQALLASGWFRFARGNGLAPAGERYASTGTTI